MIERDIHRAHGLATLAILQATEAVKARLGPEQLAQLEARMADGSGRLVLAITSDGHDVHAELALADKEPREFFDKALLRFDGPVEAVARPPEEVSVTDRRRMS